MIRHDKLCCEEGPIFRVARPASLHLYGPAVYACCQRRNSNNTHGNDTPEKKRQHKQKLKVREIFI